MNQKPNFTPAPSLLVPHGPDEGQMRDYIQVMWRRMWVIIVAFFLLFSTVLVWTFRMNPVYQASAVLEIQRSGDSGAMSLENLFSDQLAAGGDKEV